MDQARQVVQRAEAITSYHHRPGPPGAGTGGCGDDLAEVGDEQARQVVQRAEAIAGSITDMYKREPSLIAVAEAATKTGDIDRARQIIRQAEALVRSSTSIGFAWNLVNVAEALAKTGDVDGAGAITASLTNPIEREWALTRTAKGAARPGEVDWAEAAAVLSPTRICRHKH